MSDPHVQENGFAPNTETPHGRYGTYQRHGPVVTLAGTPGRYGPGVLGGEHTDAILAEIGYDAAAIAGFRARNIVGSEQP